MKCRTKPQISSSARDLEREIQQNLLHLHNHCHTTPPPLHLHTTRHLHHTTASTRLPHHCIYTHLHHITTPLQPTPGNTRQANASQFDATCTSMRANPLDSIQVATKSLQQDCNTTLSNSRSFGIFLGGFGENTACHERNVMEVKGDCHSVSHLRYGSTSTVKATRSLHLLKLAMF